MYRSQHSNDIAAATRSHHSRCQRSFCASLSQTIKAKTALAESYAVKIKRIESQMADDEELDTDQAASLKSTNAKLQAVTAEIVTVQSALAAISQRQSGSTVSE